MKSNRRKFIKSGAVLAAAGFLLPHGAEAKKYPAPQEFKNKADEDLWQLVRNSFPLTDGVTYLNNGTMGPSPYSVIEAQYKSILDVDTTGNYGGWEVAVPALARFVNVDENEVCLTRNVTEGINIVCWGLQLKKGDEVIVTDNEHVGNALPWLNRAKLDGIVLKTVALAATGAETLNRINALITKKTRVIAVPHIPCTQGQVLPAKQICQLAKEKGIYSFIDGAHGPGMLTLDLHDMGCDFYASCCHKWMLGPKGTGFLYIKHEKLNDLQAKWVGGYSDTGWNLLTNPPELKGYVDSAHRYYYGSMSAPLYIGVAEAISFHETIGKGKIEARVKALASHFYKHLQALGDKVEILTPAEEASRAAIIGFRIKAQPDDKFTKIAQDNRLRIRYVGENGLNSHRASFHIYNTFAEADKLAEVVAQAAG
jgi:cysteine desulfurase / selenocysteine lyase